MVVEHHHIELDYCLKCTGVWLDAGELDLLIAVLREEGAILSDVDITPQDADVEQAKRRCPICGRKMKKVWMGKGQAVLIDSCPQGDGLWFDSGELQKVIHGTEMSGTPPLTGVLPFVGEAFRATCKHDEKE